MHIGGTRARVYMHILQWPNIPAAASCCFCAAGGDDDEYKCVLFKVVKAKAVAKFCQL